MSMPIQILVDPSQFPQALEKELLAGLRAGEVNPKFHYLTPRQTLAWLRLHERYAPFFHQSDGRELYETAFRRVLDGARPESWEVISLGCGAGQKEARFFKQLSQGAIPARYLPVDGGAGMVITAHQTVQPFLAADRIRPVVADLFADTEVTTWLASPGQESAQRLVLLFGLLPNIDPTTSGPVLTRFLRKQDWLLLSANLAPGGDYRAGTEAVLPLYDNAETVAWLRILLEDLGMEPDCGRFSFAVEAGPGLDGLLRIVVWYEFTKKCRLLVGDESIEFRSGDRLRLFYSNRYTPALVGALCTQWGLHLEESWISEDREEGIFLCRTSHQAGVRRR